MKENIWHHRDTKDYNRVLQKIMCQQIGQPRRKGYIPHNLQSFKIESGRIKKSEQTYY